MRPSHPSRSRRRGVFLGVTLAALVLLCLPWRTTSVHTYARNLWTARSEPWDFNWAEPSTSSDLLKWRRHEFGARWSVLVVDRGIDHPAWHARFDSGVFVLYALTAAVVGGGFGPPCPPWLSRETCGPLDFFDHW